MGKVHANHPNPCPLVGAAAQSPCAEYAQILQSWHDRLQDYGLAEVAIIAVLSSGQALTDFQHQTGHQLIEDDGSFRPVEIATKHQRWIEMVLARQGDVFQRVQVNEVVPLRRRPLAVIIYES